MGLAKFFCSAALALICTGGVIAAEGPAPLKPATPQGSLAAALPATKWIELEHSVDRGLAWMAEHQAVDGSFTDGRTSAAAQPAVTSFCVMAFLSRGHLPGFGPYGAKLEKAIDFVLACQKPDGLFCYESPEAVWVSKMASHTATYNHAIAGLMLGEVYGHVTGRRMKEVKQAIDRALQFTRDLQTRPKTFPQDRGGWRYLRLHYDHTAADSDLSVTACQLMFLRSARNAEFEVPQSYIDDAMSYVHRSFDTSQGVFMYTLSGAERYSSRGLMGAGIVSLSLAGQHQTPMALAAGEWLLARPFRRYGEMSPQGETFCYSTYYVSQAALQLGGKYWEGIFPPLARALMEAQEPDGSWPLVGNGDETLGRVYCTAMSVLSLTPGYQLLPVYQR